MTSFPVARYVADNFTHSFFVGSIVMLGTIRLQTSRNYPSGALGWDARRRCTFSLNYVTFLVIHIHHLQTGLGWLEMEMLKRMLAEEWDFKTLEIPVI